MAFAGMTLMQRLTRCRVYLLTVSQHKSGAFLTSLKKKVFYNLGSDVGTFALTSIMGVTELRLTNNSAHLHHFTDCVGMFCMFETVIFNHINNHILIFNIVEIYVKAYLFFFPPDVY